jgi:negative regulator of replication initiation
MNKSKFIGLRLDEKLYNKLADAALHEGESMSSLIRRILNQHYQTPGKTEGDGGTKNHEL